jgi:hypothetical protein
MASTLRRLAGVLVLASVLAASPVVAADEAPRVGTITRLVKLFLDKEAELAAAARSGNAAALGAFLTDDFELRAGARVANPVPRAEWIRELTRSRDPGGEIGRMAVHDFGTVAVVSFTQDAAGGTLFVVDVWRRAGSDWKLAVRYASPAGTSAFPIPGSGPVAPEIPKKY